MFCYFVISTFICNQKLLVNLHVNSLKQNQAAALIKFMNKKHIYMIFHFPVTLQENEVLHH